MAVGDVTAEKIAAHSAASTVEDQGSPGIDASSERGSEIARSQHFKTHHNRTGHEGNEIEGDGKPPLRGRSGGASVIHSRSPLKRVPADVDTTCGDPAIEPAGRTRMPRHLCLLLPRHTSFRQNMPIAKQIPAGLPIESAKRLRTDRLSEETNRQRKIAPRERSRHGRSDRPPCRVDGRGIFDGGRRRLDGARRNAWRW